LFSVWQYLLSPTCRLFWGPIPSHDGVCWHRMARTQPQAGKAAMRSTERGRWFGDGGSRVVSSSTAVYPPIHTPAPGARLSVQSHDIAWAGRSKEEVCTHVAAHAVVHVVGIEGAQQIQLLPSKKFEHRSAQARARTRTHAQTGSARRHTHTQQRARRQPRSAQSAACAAAQRRRPGNTHRTLAC